MLIGLPWDAAKASPALSVRAAAGEVMIAASRRNLRSSIASAESVRDGLAPPSKIAEGMGSVSTRERRDCSPMSSAQAFTTEHDEGTGRCAEERKVRADRL